jgi:hypothetical protein
MKDISNISNISEQNNKNDISNISKASKNNNLNLTKLSNGSNDFRELNKEIFKIIEDGGNISGLSISSNNISNSLPSFNDINWKKKSDENSSFLTGNNSNISNLSNRIPKKQIEVLNMKNTFDENDMINNNINNINYNNTNNNNMFNNNKNKNYNKFSMVPEDSQYQDDFMENKIHFTNVKKINKNENRRFNNNNDINNNLILNYNQSNLINMNNSNTNQIGNKNKNFISKSNFQMMMNNQNSNINNNINNNMNNNMNNNAYNISINNNNNQNMLNSNQQYMFYQNQIPQNNYIFQGGPNPIFFPENAFSYNNTPINTKKNQKNQNGNNNNNNPNKNNNNDKKAKNKKKFKDKIEQKLFVIDIDNIIRGTDERTTIMIRHIPNKYTSEALLEELNTICKSKYDFFYLPLDNENECNLGYAFINFVHPLHIVHFYHIFKARKWNLYKSNKECDLSFAKFQGKAELTANLDKNMNNFEDKKKLPMVFETITTAKIDMEKKYFDDIKNFQPDKLKNINWI